MTSLAVVGGGIAGLAAAWEAASRGVDVTLIEASERVGGKIVTRPFAGVPSETGPDSFLARVPAATTLAKEVGLGDDLVAPATGEAYLWVGGRLRPIPTGTVLGVPRRGRSVGRLLGWPTAARVALDRVLPGRPAAAGDAAVGDLVRRRLGAKVQTGLVDPLVGGINAGRSDELSAAVAAPQILAAAQADRSLLRGLGLAPEVSGAPVFLTVAGGLARLPDAIGAALGQAVVLGDAVVALGRRTDGWTLELASGRRIEADRVVIATPPGAAADLLAPVSPDAAAGLRRIRTSSVVLTTFVYGYVPLRGSGFLVPRGERRLMTGCTWVSTKWPHVHTPGRILVRASAGRVDDPRVLAMDDDEIVAALHAELSEAMGLRTAPLETAVHRWPDAFPQYPVHHLDHVRAIEGALPPGVALAGAALRGVGIATCIAGGRAAAAHLLTD